MKRRIAVIDIGTNSILLTIPEPLFEAMEITRLGKNLGVTGKLDPAGKKKTISVIKKYLNKCSALKVEKVFAIATEAMRRAKDAKQFSAEVKKECGINIKTITGKEEAALARISAEHDFGKNIMTVDIGGGSTEVSGVSIPIGCVSLHERFCNALPSPLPLPLGERGFYPKLPAKKRGAKLIATGGTATTLVAMKLKSKKYDHGKVHGHVLKRSELSRIIKMLSTKTLAEKKRIIGLHPKRADVILPGAMILLAILDHYKFNAVTVSDKGVRWGVIYTMSYMSDRMSS